MKSTNQLSDADLEQAINRYYFYQFVLEVRPAELSDYWTFNTTISDDTESLDDDTYILTTGDGYVDGYDLMISFDSASWYSRWPETTTYSESRPTEALFYGGVLYMNPPPDAVYAVKIPAFVRPSTLTSDSDTPTREEWGPTIAYGTAFEILNDKGNVSRAAEILPVKNMHISNLRYKSEQVFNTERAMPKW
ncbi:hypothetical protein OAF54_02115 [bacterium]|nr:hypothetical protein [bacterium]